MERLRGLTEAALDGVGRWLGGQGGDAALGRLPPDQKVLVSIALVVALALLRLLLLRLVLPSLRDSRSRYRWRRVTQYAFGALAVFLVMEVWFPNFENLATYLGLLSAGVAIALRDPIANLVAWSYLLWRRPMSVGDRVQIGDVAGDVVDMRLFEFTLNEIGNWVHADQSTGRVVHVPNQRVFTEPLANYTRGFPYIWNELRVPITLDSDWAAAKSLLLEIAGEASREVIEEAEAFKARGSSDYLIVFGTLTPTVYTSVEDRGIVLTLRHLVRPRQRRGATEALWEAILARLQAHDRVQLAWPTQRIELARARPHAPARAEDEG